MRITYSDGRTITDAVRQIWDDLHTERAGYYRAYWTDGPDATCGSPVIGYCSPSGSHRTIHATIAECRALGHSERVYRDGRQVPA